jgi:hypothetical protein
MMCAQDNSYSGTCLAKHQGEVVKMTSMFAFYTYPDPPGKFSRLHFQFSAVMDCSVKAAGDSYLTGVCTSRAPCRAYLAGHRAHP